MLVTKWLVTKWHRAAFMVVMTMTIHQDLLICVEACSRTGVLNIRVGWERIGVGKNWSLDCKASLKKCWRSELGSRKWYTFRCLVWNFIEKRNIQELAFRVSLFGSEWRRKITNNIKISTTLYYSLELHWITSTV